MEPACCRLQDKVAIVTGGASGIGRASVLRFLEEGAKVVLADINPETAAVTLDGIRRQGKGDRVRFCLCDVTSEDDMARLVRFAVAEFGRLDCFVNNAGTGGAIAHLLETSVEHWDRTQALILRSVFLGIKHAAQAMIKQGGGGTIINMSSNVAIRGGWAGAAYSAAKAGVLNLTRCAAVELAEHRIRCNCILPGTIITPLLARGGDREEIARIAVSTQVWPEPGLPEHIASVVAFLASDDSQFVVGEGIIADGGQATAVGSADIYNGKQTTGSIIYQRIKEAGIEGFDPGTTRVVPDQPVVLRDDKPRTVVLTGVSRGLGLALAERLIEIGHTVLGCARSEKAVAELQQRFGPPHRFDVVNIADDDQVRRWAEAAMADHQAPDLLVNNAAIAGFESKQMWRQTPEYFLETLRVNVLGVVHVLRHFVPPMLKRLRGVIVNFSSGWGREVAPKIGAYGVSKFAIEGLTRILACELPPNRMAAVSLHPGIIHTKTMEVAFGEYAHLYPTPEQWAKVAAPYLLGLDPQDNGKALAVPGMTEFRGMRRPSGVAAPGRETAKES